MNETELRYNSSIIINGEKKYGPKLRKYSIQSG